MASAGADLQGTNNELVAVIEELRERRGELDRAIHREEEQRQQVAAEIEALKARLGALDQGLAAKYATRAEFDKTLQETSLAFGKILDSSRVLLTAVKRDSLALTTRPVE